MKKTATRDAEDSDEEVSTISGPIRQVSDDLQGYIPRVTLKEPRLSDPKKGDRATTEKNGKIETDVRKIEENKEIKPRFSSESNDHKLIPPAKSVVDSKFQGSGIIDMMNEIDNLGLDEVQIRPIANLKRSLKAEQNTTPEIKENSNIPRPRTTDKRQEVFAEAVEKKQPATISNWGESSNSEKQKTEKKSGISGIAVRPMKKSNAPRYVEQPTVIPDDPNLIQNSSRETRKPETSTKTSNKEVKKFQEANRINPQGYDVDHENWDEELGYS